MNVYVPDASVAAKWVLPPVHEGLTEEALGLLARFTKGEVRFVVPDLFWAEMANILWKAVRAGRCTEESAESALALMLERSLPTVSSSSLVKEAFAIATTFQRTVYDGLYVALAVVRKAELVTADERLANALAAYFPVKWLGAL